MWKDKRDKKRLRREEKEAIERGEKADRPAEYELRTYVVGSPKFDEYYKR